MKRLICLFMVLLLGGEAAEFQGYIGPHFNYIKLKPGQSDPVDGYLGGVSAGASYCYSHFKGSLDFEGSWDINYLRGDPAQKASLSEYFLEGKVGAVWSFCFNRISVYPYSGFGWHRLINEHHPSASSLCYRYDKLFIPVGFFLYYDLCQNVQIALHAEWRGDVYAHLRMNTSNFDTDLSQAVRFEIPFSICNCTPCGEVIWTVTPFFDWARFGKGEVESEAEVQLTVPAFRRWELGLRCLIGYQF